jgi:CheY-specific phosphatase CheX
MSHGHKVYVDDDGFGLVKIGDKPVRITLLSFAREGNSIAIEVRGNWEGELRAYMDSVEAMKLASNLRKMAFAAFESEAGA